MNTQQAIEIAKQYNEWRRYDGEIGEGPGMPDTKDIGEALDKLIEVAETSLSLEEEVLR